MASISEGKDGFRVLQFADPLTGKRKTLRLGKMPKATARGVKLRVEYLVASKRSGMPLDTETAEWVAKLTDDLAAKLAAVGLIPERTVLTLGAFLDSYISARKDVKPGTSTNYGIVRHRLLAHFDPNTKLRDITEGDIDAWVIHLRTKGYAQATFSMSIKKARQFFKAAVRRKLIERNPFSEVKAGTQVNKTREFFVTREMTTKVLSACPDNEWRLIVALCRYAGLRCPSELVRLCWGISTGSGSVCSSAPRRRNTWSVEANAGCRSSPR